MSEKTNEFYIERQNITESNARSYPRKFPICIKKAKGSYIEDVEGKTYIDFLCGAGTLGLGHNDDDVNKALIELINSDAPLHTLDLTTPTKDEYVHTILSLLPGDMGKTSKIQFCTPGGTDALDAALKLCKTATGRSSVVAFMRGYHGMGHGALSCTGNLADKEKVASLMPDVHFFPYPYSYRCPFGLGGEAGIKAACQFFERTLKNPESGITRPAAVVIEPIQGEGGVIPAPVEFLQTVRRVTKELDIPMIVDEIQCGIGRSGKLFAFEYADIIPDVILTSKAIGGSLPMSLVIYNKKLDVWGPGTHAGTFRGNQLAMKAGTVLLNKVSKPEFLADVTRKSGIILKAYNDLKSKVKIIGDVRGKGLMIGVEFIDPNSPKDELGTQSSSGEIAAMIQKKCFEKGLIMEKGGDNGSVMRCLCALNVDDETISKALKIFEAVVLEIDSKYE